MFEFIWNILSWFRGDVSHPVIGKEFVIGETTICVKRLLATDEITSVYLAQDLCDTSYALKCQSPITSPAISALHNEISIMAELRDHPNILKYYNTKIADTQYGGSEFMILTELCTGDSVMDLMNMGPLSTSQVLRIFYAACRAVKHMHCRVKSITHGNIKIENLLVDEQGTVKLCDFQISTRKQISPENSWERFSFIEEAQRYTAPENRAPEISDDSLNLPIGPQQDIWALGCVLFYLCFGIHPFKGSTKLRIINAEYTIPTGNPADTRFIPLIQSCLQPLPADRPTISDLVNRTEALSAAMGINLDHGLGALNLPSDLPIPERDERDQQSDQRRTFPSSDAAATPAPQSEPDLIDFEEDGPESNSSPRAASSAHGSSTGAMPQNMSAPAAAQSDSFPWDEFEFDAFTKSRANSNSNSRGNSTASTPKQTRRDRSTAREQLAEDVQAVQKRVQNWAAGKEKDIRALLGSLNEILWNDANWQQPSTTTLAQNEQIKKCYQKAILLVHPDKQTGTPHVELAQAICKQLNLAWTVHEENPNM